MVLCHIWGGTPDLSIAGSVVFSRAAPAGAILQMNVKKRLLDGARMSRAIRRMAIEIVEKNRGTRDLLIVGIRSRGVPIGERLTKEIEEMEGHPVPFGILDITLYRDDLTTIAPQPVVKPTKLPEPIDDKVVVLVDDVLYTGRTVRAALDALIDFGRPRAVMLAVLIDRGHRELPIHADVIGKTVPTDADEVIKVRMAELDGEDEVLIMEK
jgi:pyrimidine operon attenuation protein/uracil phosphoribosyltransferase